MLSQTTAQTFQEEVLNKLVKNLKTSLRKGLTVRSLEFNFLKIVGYSDGSSNRNAVGSSVADYLMSISNKHNNENLIDYEIIKSRRVVRSLLGYKTYRLADCCDV